MGSRGRRDPGGGAAQGRSGAAESNLVYQSLQPEDILAAVESLGYRCDGRTLALNSYENRVYRVGLEEQPPLVAKFYRPARWSDAAILEEHAFAVELTAAELPVVAPLVQDGTSLHHRGPFASRSIRATAAAHRSSTISRCSSSSAASSHASTCVASERVSGIGRRSISIPTGSSPTTSCSRKASFPRI
jgi:hypothetical protein